MYKDLEKEYKELMSADAPDLWAKIEAGLEPKQLNAKKKNRFKRMSVWGVLAAACLCLVISVPVLFGGRKGSSAGGNMSDVNMGAAAAAENVDSEAAEGNAVSFDAADDKVFEAADIAAEGNLTSDKFKNKRIYFVKNKIFP